jgi:FkbM family methyltransferase
MKMVYGEVMKIAIIDTLGLTYDGSTLDKRGLGGSESAVILMSKELAKLGFDVTVFNDCTSDDSKSGVYNGVVYQPLKTVESCDKFDVMIGSRSVAAFAPRHMIGEFKNFIGGLPDFTRIQQNSRHKVLWMHDTFCDGDLHLENFLLDGFINEIFTLSDFHTDYVTNCDHGKRRNFEVLKRFVFQTRNGIGNMPKKFVDITKKDPNLFIYNSSVTKGMIPLVTKIWPEVKRRHPEAKLTVIGGYYKFRENAQPDEQEQKYRDLVAKYGKDINFTGIITQKEISDILTDASYMIYPAAFPETFGISALEAMAHNVPLITNTFGALEETAFDLACYKIPYAIEPNGLFPWIPADVQEQRFTDMVSYVHANKYLHQQKMYACNQIKDICTWDTVALQWKQHFYKKLGEFLPVAEYRKVTKINNKVRKVFGRRFMNLEELTEPVQSPFWPITIITPAYNAEKYIARCIESVAQQDYHNYMMHIIDDASTDDTVKVAMDCIDSLPENIRYNFRVHLNSENHGAVCNQVNTIQNECGHDIVMLLDGDDWLVNDPNIFHMYNNLYNEGAEFTYGSCWSLADNIPLIAQEYPPEVKANKLYRDYKFNWNMPYTHLRTFKSQLMKNHLSWNGNYAFRNPETLEWLKAGGDTAVFYAMIEAADPDKVVCVSDIVYNYNDLNPLNDYKINGDEQTKNANAVLAKKSAKFTAIIPTMWRCLDITEKLLTNLIEHPLVGEVIIINNDHVRTPEWSLLLHDKINMLLMDENIGVNPAWNLGVENSNYDLLCIINDDIVFDPKLFDKIEPLMYASDAGAFGIINGDPEMGQPAKTDGSIDFLEWQPGMIIHCFGQLMFMHKKNWVPIPDGLLINFGDDVIFHSSLQNYKKNYLIYNIDFETQWSATVKDPTVTLVSPEQFEREKAIYCEWADWNPIPAFQPEPARIKNILIAIPCKNDIEADTFKSIYDLIIPDGYKAHFQYFYGYAVDQVRNLIADWIVKGYDYLFAVDHDMIFAPDTLQKLLAADKSIVSGIYRQRLEPQTIEIYDHNFRHIPYENLVNRGLIEIGGSGFGCVLVKKEALADVGYPQFVYHQALDHANTFSEDLDFCKKAREKGHTIWCDTSIVCGHVGTKIYTPELPAIATESLERTRLRELRKMDLFPQDHINYLKKLKHGGFEPKVIYDIGACVLHWTDKAKTVWPDATYVAFDAMDAAKFIYEEERMGYACGVLGSEDGKLVEFWENTENPAGNSVYKENNKLSPLADQLYSKSVQKYTGKLDTIIESFGFKQPDLIKIDVQGSELDILKGATKVLEQCDNIILEMQHVDYNKGAPKAQEVIEYLESIGFENKSGMFSGGEIDGDYHFVRTRLFHS